MLRRIKSAIPFFSYLTPEEAYEAAHQGDLVALKKFIEHIQSRVNTIKAEYELDNANRSIAGSPPPWHNISKDYTFDSVRANAGIWYTIYTVAAHHNHIYILNLLHRTSCIELNKMRLDELSELLCYVINDRESSTDTLIYIITEALVNESIVGFLNISCESFMLAAIKSNKVESAKFLLKVCNINLNDNRAVYKTLITAACHSHKREMIAFLAKECHVDKSYILECLTEILRSGNRRIARHLRGLFNEIDSQIAFMPITDVMVVENPLVELQPANQGLRTHNQVNNIVDNSTQLAFTYQFLTQEEAFEAARRGNIAAIKLFVKNMEIEVKSIKEAYEHENERRMNLGLPRTYNYGRCINEEYSMNSVSANSHLWYGIYKCAALYKHTNIMNLLHSSSFIRFDKMNRSKLEAGLLDGLSPDIQEFVQNAFVQMKYITIPDDDVTENKSPQQSANRNLQTTAQINSIVNSNVLSPAAVSNAAPEEMIILSLPNGEDATVLDSSSIVAKDKGEADVDVPETSSSSSTMEPVVSNSPPSTSNNLQPGVQTKKWETLIQSFPNDYANSNDNTGNLKRDLELLKYQVSQIQASLATEQEITHELRKQKILMEQLDYIANGDEIVLAYFMQLKSHLTDCFIASRIISSGMVERAPYLLTDKLKKLLGNFSSLLTGVANFAAFASSEAGKTATELLKSLGDGLHIGGFMKELLPSSLSELLTSLIESEENCIERIAVISSGKNYTLSGLEYTADVIALTLTYIYRPQIKCLTEEGAKLLAQCSAERVMLLGKEGIVNRSNEWIPVVIALIGQPTMKQTSFFREINIATKKEYQGRWTENGIHCESGIMCLDEDNVIFYANTETLHNQYGFRINGRSIAENIYMMKVLASDQVSEDVKRTSSQYFLCNVSHSPKLLEKASCDDVQQSNNVSLIPTSFTAASDQNNSLYLASALQEIRSQVARVESEHMKLRDENAELKDKIELMESHVTNLSRRQHEHHGLFQHLRNTGIDIDRPVEAGSVLLQTVEFSDPHGRGTFFLSQQTQSISRLGTLEQVVAELCDAQKLHGNK